MFTEAENMAYEHKIKAWVDDSLNIGDVIMSFNILYNIARERGEKVSVRISKNRLASQLCSIFDYDRKLDFTNSNGGKFSHFCVARHICAKDASDRFCNMSLGGISDTDYRMVDSFELPKCLVKPERNLDEHCFQMDGRSPWSGKPRMRRFEMMQIIRMFGKGKSTCIGGPGTDRYVDHPDFYVSDLVGLSRRILGSKGFFGVDSGMSHLAGTLQVPGDIVIQAIDEESRYSKCVHQVYNSIYPNLKTHKRTIVKHLPLL